MFAFVALVSVLLSVLWVRRPKRPAQFPPGPPTYLIFGNIFEAISLLKGNFRMVMKTFKETFGDIVGFIRPNGDKLVHFFKFEDIKEVCKKPGFTGRPSQYANLIRTYHQKLGLVFNDGPAWVEHRRFALRHLKDLGFGKNSMESVVLEEFEHLSKEMRQATGSAMKVNFRFHLTVLNILWKVVADMRLDSEDPESKTQVTNVKNFFNAIGPTNPMNIAPWLRHFFPEWSGYAPIVRHRDANANMFRQLIQEHKRTLDPSNPRDLIDLFLLEMRTDGAAGRQYTELNLAVIGMDLFLAGMETSSTTLTWALHFMVTRPDIQTRIQREIDEVIGSRRPTYDDRISMPYTEATLMEVTRRVTAVPQGIPHAAMEDTSIGGYRIPKGTMLLLHVEAVHMDPEYWGDPEAFRPERFLTEDGTVRRDERLIPFGIGKRLCIGEMLARMELFMLFTCLLQSFTFAAAPGQTMSLETACGVVQQPAEFFVTYQLRN